MPLTRATLVPRGPLAILPVQVDHSLVTTATIQRTAPPPYYAKSSQEPQTQGWRNWRPGFWTGAAVGGLANHALNQARARATAPQAYDWEARPQAPIATFFVWTVFRAL